MINLLSDDDKRNIRAARTNVLLLRYNILSAGGIILLVAICALFYFVMNTNQSRALSASQSNSVEAASYNSIRTQADEYRQNLSVAKTILTNSTNYTDLVFSIAKLVPSGVILENLTLDSTTVGQQTTFTAHAVSYEKAAELKQNFQNSTTFTNVFFESLTDNTAGSVPGAPSTLDKYPIAVSLSAQMNKATK